MKILLPHREVELDLSLGFQDRNEAIFSILEEEIELHDENMTVEEYLRFTWNKHPSKITMDIIGYYLTKNNYEGEDREVISNRKIKEMVKGSKRHTTFSSMAYADQVEFGVVDPEDYEYN